MEPGTSSISPPKRAVFVALTLFFSLAAVLSVSEIILRIKNRTISQSDRMDPGLMRYDRTLGWRMTPGWRGAHRHHDFQAQYTTNTYGFRGRFDIPPAPSGKVIAVVGDSFTFGIGVDDHETFVQLLTENPGDPNVYLNFSVPGYSTDQQYLLIREQVLYFSPQAVLLVVYLGNDLFDNLLPYPLQADRAKPYFKMENGGLTLHNVPVPMATKPPELKKLDLSRVVFGEPRGRGKRWMDYANRLELLHFIGLRFSPLDDTDTEFASRFHSAERLFFAIVDQLSEMLSAQDIELKLILLAGQSFVEHPDSPSAHFQDYLRRKVMTGCKERHIGVIDLATTLLDFRKKRSGRWFFTNEGHLTTEGHRAVADVLYRNGVMKK